MEKGNWEGAQHIPISGGVGEVRNERKSSAELNLSNAHKLGFYHGKAQKLQSDFLHMNIFSLEKKICIFGHIVFNTEALIRDFSSLALHIQNLRKCALCL